MIIVFVIVAILGRSILQYRLTGDYGIRTAHKSSSVMVKLAAVLIGIVFFGVIIISGLFAFTDFIPVFQLGIYSNAVGFLFCLSGMILTSISQVQMGKEWRIGVDDSEKTELVIHGLYSTIRNPIYAGVMLFGFGLLVLIPHLSMLVITVLGYIAIELQVRKIEEPYLEYLHGQSFTNYSNTTGRYIPKWK